MEEGIMSLAKTWRKKEGRGDDTWVWLEREMTRKIYEVKSDSRRVEE